MNVRPGSLVLFAEDSTDVGLVLERNDVLETWVVLFADGMLDEFDDAGDSVTCTGISIRYTERVAPEEMLAEALRVLAEDPGGEDDAYWPWDELLALGAA